MKSFIKSHRRSSSAASDAEKMPVTPKLAHGGPAFSPRQKSPGSSPTAPTSSAFKTSPLPPPPPSAFAHGWGLSVGSAPPSPQHGSPSEHGKRARLKGLLKHKSSRGSMTASNPGSPVVASKSFVTFSDSNLTVPSQTPDFIVDRPATAAMSVLGEKSTGAALHVPTEPRDHDDSATTGSTLASAENIALDHLDVTGTPGLRDSDVAEGQPDISVTCPVTCPVTCQPPSPLETPMSSPVADSEAGPKLNIHDTSLVSTGESSGESSTDTASQASVASSEFSFEANRTYGRSTSIKYYKKKEDLERQRAEEAHKRFIGEFIGGDTNIDDLDDDFNFDDPEVQDDTQSLFNRKLFSSDEEDAEELEDFEGSDYADDILDEVNGSDDEHEQDVASVPADLQLQEHHQDNGETENAYPQSQEMGDPPRVVTESESPEAEEKLVNSISKRMSHMTVDPTAFELSPIRSSMGTSQRNKLGLNLRQRSLKYHQISGTSDDDLRFLHQRYSWYMSDEEAAVIQKKLALMDADAHNVSSVINTRPNSDDFESFGGVSMSSSDRFDESLIDEINQMPEDFEFAFDKTTAADGHPVRELSNSARHKQNRSSGGALMAPSSSTGTRFDKKDRTVTLFRSSSGNSKSTADVVDKSDDDEGVSSGPPQLYQTMNAPNAAFKGHESPLTTISEGSFDSNASPKL